MIERGTPFRPNAGMRCLKPGYQHWLMTQGAEAVLLQPKRLYQRRIRDRVRLAQSRHRLRGCFKDRFAQAQIRLSKPKPAKATPNGTSIHWPESAFSAATFIPMIIERRQARSTKPPVQPAGIYFVPRTRQNQGFVSVIGFNLSLSCLCDIQ